MELRRVTAKRDTKIPGKTSFTYDLNHPVRKFIKWDKRIDGHKVTKICSREVKNFCERTKQAELVKKCERLEA